MFLNQTNRTRHRKKKHESTRKRSRYTHSDGRGKRLWKHITKMQKCFYSAVGVQASCLGPGRPLFVSQILKEQDAFCAPQKKTCRQTGGFEGPQPSAALRFEADWKLCFTGVNESERRKLWKAEDRWGTVAGSQLWACVAFFLMF